MDVQSNLKPSARMVDPDNYREVDTPFGCLEQFKTICSDGGTGRHAGLKILFALKRVRVRFPLRVQRPDVKILGLFVPQCSLNLVVIGQIINTLSLQIVPQAHTLQDAPNKSGWSWFEDDQILFR